MKRLTLTLLFLLFISWCMSNVVYSQKTDVNPYIGASLNFEGVSTLGWGLDGGLKFKTFYIGIEYGSYGREVNSVLAPVGVTIYPVYEDFYGIHGGAEVTKILSLGLVCLFSISHHYDGSTTPHFDAGPDVRLDTRIGLIFGVAYSLRRGANAGINFLF
jgi:hypothetical protein